MIKYIKHNTLPILIGVVIGMLSFQILNTIEDILIKIALIMK